MLEGILRNCLKLSKPPRGLLWSILVHINLVSLYMLHGIYCRREMLMKLFGILFLLLSRRNILCNCSCQGTEKIEAIKVFILVSLRYQFDLFGEFDEQIMAHYSFGFGCCLGWQHRPMNNQYDYSLRHIFHYRNQTFY